MDLFSNAVTDGANCLVSNVNMISKIYFPRVLMPMSAVAARLIDFCVGLVVLGCLMAWYRIVPTWGTLLLPLFVGVMVLTASGLGMWLTALAVQYRDVKHAMNFVVQILMYAAPVVYPASLIPTRYQLIYALNPMVGVIEGFRAALLGTRAIPWTLPPWASLPPWLLLVLACFTFAVENAFLRTWRKRKNACDNHPRKALQSLSHWFERANSRHHDVSAHWLGQVAFEEFPESAQT